jgi:hypothetical protein
MKRLLSIIVILVVPFLAITSCENILSSGNEAFELVLVGDTAVKNNEKLSIGVKETFDGYYYELFVPMFSTPFSGHSYSEDFATVRNQGWYKVRASRDGRYEEDSLYVHVIPDSVPCDVETNRIISNSSINYTFGQINGSPYFDDYRVEGYNFQADLYILFANINEKPKPGTYISEPCHELDTEGYACVRINVGFSVYGKSGQKIHVFEENGKTYISLCDFELDGGIIADAKFEISE